MIVGESPRHITLATEACQEKINEIKAVPRLIDSIDESGKVLAADAMSMQVSPR